MNKKEMQSNIIFRVGARSAVIVWGGEWGVVWGVVWGRYLAIGDQGTLLSSEGLGSLSPGKAIYRHSEDIAPQHL